MQDLTPRSAAPGGADAGRAGGGARAVSAGGAVGRLGGVRRDGLAAQGRAPLHADPHDLLQLRGGAAGCWPTSTSRPSRSASSRATRCTPAAAGRNCAKGPATLNQIKDPERILYPLERAGARGEGKWERVTWDEVLDDIGGRIRKALVEGRHNEVMYHVGPAGPRADLHGARLPRLGHRRPQQPHQRLLGLRARGLRVLDGLDRPSPDHANARFILLLSSHLETGHYFNPHAQRIIEGKMAGAKICVVDTRLSNTAVDGRLLALALAGHRGRDAAGHRARACCATARTTASSCGAG